MQVWRADVKRKDVRQEQTSPNWEGLGGRGLIARILLDEVPPDCDSLGPHNKLIWALGLLVGHRLSSCDRISVGGKSPLTGGVKESNAGGTTGLMLTHLGIKALLVEGAAIDNLWHVLLLDSQGGRYEPADDLSGEGVYQTAEKIRQRYGSGIGLALIGPGGQRQMLAAGIQNLDKDDESLTNKRPWRLRRPDGQQTTAGRRYRCLLLVSPPSLMMMTFLNVHKSTSSISCSNTRKQLPTQSTALRR